MWRRRYVRPVVFAAVAAAVALTGSSALPARAGVVAPAAPTAGCVSSGQLGRLRPYTDTAGRPLTPTCWRPVGTDGATSPGSLLYDVDFTTPYLVPNADHVSATNPIVPAPKARVLLPADYFTARHKHYPVIFLLHGANDPTYVAPTATNTADPDRGGGSYRSWTDTAVSGGDLIGDLATTGSLSSAIVVMPEGGDNGWYSDWVGRSAAHPLSPSYESFHIGQLVPWVDRNFRTFGTAAGRAVVGLSMGGHGAVTYAERHSGTFAAVATFSGALNNEDDGRYGGFPRVSEGLLISLVLGPFKDDEGDPRLIWGGSWNGLTDVGSGPDWDAHNVPKHVTALAHTDLTIYSGAQDPAKPVGTAARCSISNPDVGGAVLESAACVSAEQFDTQVLAAKVPLRHLTFQQFAGYVHSFPAWNHDLKLWLPHGLAVLTRAH